MKNLKSFRWALLFAVITCLFTLPSCKKDKPEASFTMDKTKAFTYEVISFTNTSLNADTYEWDFGDGSRATTMNAEHQFTQLGTYTVKLKAKGEGGSNEISRVVEITPAIFPGLSVDGISIGSTFGSIRSKYADFVPLHTWIYDIGSGKSVHLLEYRPLGLTFGFVNSTSSVNSYDAVIGIFARAPYQRCTAESIIVGSPLSVVKAAYGTPVIDNQTKSYKYPSAGISFRWAGSSQDEVYWMFVYEKDNLQGGILHDALVNTVLENQ